MIERMKGWNGSLEDLELDHPYWFWGTFSVGLLVLGLVLGDLRFWSAIALGSFFGVAVGGRKQRERRRAERSAKRVY